MFCRFIDWFYFWRNFCCRDINAATNVRLKCNVFSGWLLDLSTEFTVQELKWLFLGLGGLKFTLFCFFRPWLYGFIDEFLIFWRKKMFFTRNKSRKRKRVEKNKLYTHKTKLFTRNKWVGFVEFENWVFLFLFYFLHNIKQILEFLQNVFFFVFYDFFL